MLQMLLSLLSIGLIGINLMDGGGPDDSIVDNWTYMDREGNLSKGDDCRVEYQEYKKKSPYYA